jgi:prephenate dehydrogenase
MRVAIVGLGLIGGSLARALLRAGIIPSATDADRDTVLAARRDGILAEDASDDGLRRALGDATVIMIAVPVTRIGRTAAQVLASSTPGAHVLHAGSLQRPDALGLQARHADQVVGTHPLAGTHESGYAPSRASLFDGAAVSIELRADPSHRASAEQLWTAAGATSFAYRTAEEHDRLMAWVSHLPQLVAVALAATLESAGVDHRSTGPGARDTTRLAASPYPVWEGILAGAPPDTVRALEETEAMLARIRTLVAARASPNQELSELWNRGRRWKLEESRR